jgi:KaiC/GvpD/RAD55 family RecA-like ATPase
VNATVTARAAPRISNAAPHSVEAEQSVYVEAEQSLLGALLIDNSAFERLRTIVTAADFSRAEHQTIYQCLVAEIQQGRPADITTVAEALSKVGKLELAGGMAYLGQIAVNTPSSFNAYRYAELVRERARRRELVSLGQELQARAQGRADVGDVLRDTASRLEALAEATSSPSSQRFPRVWLDDAQADLSNNDYVAGVIGALALVLIYGPTASGKTFFAIDLIAHIASGREWRGRQVRPCPCVYVAAEAGIGVIKRFVAWRDRSLTDAHRERTPLAIITRAANLLDTIDVDALIAELLTISKEAGAPVGIVIFDTFSRSTPGGDENAAVDVTRAIAVADRLRDECGATTLFVHHTGKNVASGARGHSALEAAADTVIEVVERVANVKKSRDGPTGATFAFTLEMVELKDNAGHAATTCIVMPSEATGGAIVDKKAKLTGVAIVAMKALQEVVSADRQAMPETSSIPHGVRAATMDRWRAQFTVRYGKDGNRERDPESVLRAYRRGKEELLEHSLICISDPYVWVSS